MTDSNALADTSLLGHMLFLPVSPSHKYSTSTVECVHVDARHVFPLLFAANNGIQILIFTKNYLSQFANVSKPFRQQPPAANRVAAFAAIGLYCPVSTQSLARPLAH